MSPYDARAVANFLLDSAEEQGFALSITSLLKILYFGHGWFLAKCGRPLIGQPFEAWQFGPVVRVIYDEFKQESGKPIESRAQSFCPNVGKFQTATYQFERGEAEFLHVILMSYAKYHPYTLSDMTHDPTSPWSDVWKKAEDQCVPGMRIPNDSIRNYFLQSNAADTFRA